MGQSVSPESLHCNKETYFEVGTYILRRRKNMQLYASQVLLLDVLFYYYYYLSFSLCLMLFLLSSLFSQTKISIFLVSS